MIYDLVDMVNFVYCIFVGDTQKCIISLILKFISRNKVDWFKVGELFLYLTTYWYHMVVGIFRDVSAE